MAGGTIDLNFNNIEDVDETFASHQSTDPETEQFDRTIGLIEDLIMDNEFRSIQQAFLTKYAHEFDPELDENKLIYTDIHKEYLTIIEDFVLNKIKRSQPDFKLELFMKQLESRQEELEGEIFEFLLTFTDFLAFKEWMLDHRRSSTLPMLDINSCLQSISLQSARGNNPTPLLDQVKLDDDNSSSNQQQQTTSLDLGISGTKIKKPQDPKKK
jgi:ADP-ribosylation factor 2-binding protein